MENEFGVTQFSYSKQQVQDLVHYLDANGWVFSRTLGAVQPGLFPSSMPADAIVGLMEDTIKMKTDPLAQARDGHLHWIYEALKEVAMRKAIWPAS